MNDIKSSDPIAVASLCPVCKGTGYVQDRAVKYSCPNCIVCSLDSQLNEVPVERKPGRPKKTK